VVVGAERIGPTEIAVSIADSGVGMDADQLDRAMTPFGVADDAYDASTSGAGLGLTIAKGLIELHGGVLRVESTPQSGTNATITLRDQQVETRSRQGVAA
jgi:signal transduction histidine kinase